MDLNSDLPQLGSGRPERYEVLDQTPASPPHYTLLKAFDASHIFNKHPRKYDRLIAQEEGYSQDDTALPDNEAEMSRYRSSFGGGGVMPKRSNSLSSLDTIAIDSAMESLGSPRRTTAPDFEFDDTTTNNQMVASSSNRADNMYRRCSLDHMADYYSRRTSDAAVSAIWDPTSQDSQPSSSKATVKSAVTSYKHDQKKAEVFGERHLADIMMKAAFQDSKKSPLKEETESKDKRAKSKQSESHKKHNQEKRSSLPEINKDEIPPVGKTSSGETNFTASKVTTVQPKPRRLFGIGPLYNPLPETVIEGVPTTSLLDRVKMEGLGGGKEEKARAAPSVKKNAPTKPEVNTWAPFSM
ncbi:uncharacterized protein [Asterias amurensis]|uniref:uncharacterized protein n=1 Tax=Asterias amurensis TaxID=7602 RepID=UPI003AB701AD